MRESSKGNPSTAWINRASSCKASSSIPRVTVSFGIQSGVPLAAETWPETNDDQVKILIATVMKDTDNNPTNDSAISNPCLALTHTSGSNKLTRLCPPVRNVIAAPKVKQNGKSDEEGKDV